MLLSLVLLALYHGLDLTIADIQYSSKCGAIENNFGVLSIDNDLMGQRLQLSINLNDTSHRSCRLCAMSPAYCNTTIAPRLAQDTSYNLKIVSLEERRVSSVSYALRQDTVLISQSDICGRTYRWVILLIVNVLQPIDHDFLLLANDGGTNTLPCDRTLADISCTAANEYYIIDYTAENCLSQRDQSLEVQPTQFNQPLYYFYNNETIDQEMLLCGESWRSIFRRSRLDIWCDDTLPLYIKQKPWYQTALYAMSAWLNGRRDAALWLTLETLERTCHSRERQLALDETIFVNLSLRVDRPTYDDGVICDWIGGVDKQNITLPFYTRYYKEWFFSLYKSILPADETMPWKAPLLFALPFIIIFILVIATGLTTYHIYCRQKNNEYLRV
jgi:hypothetical protein